MNKRSDKKLVLARESVLQLSQTIAARNLAQAQGGISHNSGGECTCGPSSCGHCNNAN